MKKVFVSIFLAIFLVLQNIHFTVAQDTFYQSNYTIPKPTIEYALAYPGILPDNTLYSLKMIRDTILLFFTRDQVKKSQLHLLFADKQIGMGKSLWEKGKDDLAGVSFVESQNHFLRSMQALESYKKTHNIPPGVVDKIELSIKKHEEILQNLLDNLAVNTPDTKIREALEINHQAIQQIPLLK
jgi:hypothetical protein